MIKNKLYTIIEIPGEMEKQVKEIAFSIELPSESDVFFFPKYEKGNEVEGFVSKEFEGMVTGLNKPQEAILAEIINSKVAMDFHARYTHLPMQLAYDMVYPGGYNYTKGFAGKLYSHTIWVREDIKECSGIIPRPYARKGEGIWLYGGELIPSEINEKDALATLAGAGFFDDEGREKINRDNVYFDYSGIASARAGWFSGDECGCRGFYGSAAECMLNENDATPVFVNPISYGKVKAKELDRMQRNFSRFFSMLITG